MRTFKELAEEKAQLSKQYNDMIYNYDYFQDLQKEYNDFMEENPRPHLDNAVINPLHREAMKYKIKEYYQDINPIIKQINELKSNHKYINDKDLYVEEKNKLQKMIKSIDEKIMKQLKEEQRKQEEENKLKETQRQKKEEEENK